MEDYKFLTNEDVDQQLEEKQKTEPTNTGMKGQIPS